MQPLKIIYVIDRYYSPHGGTESQLLMLIEGMLSRGHEVRLFILRHTEFSLTPSAFPVPFESLDVQSGFSTDALSAMLQFRRVLRTARPDAIHAYFNDAAVLVPIFCAMSGIPVITSRRDMGFWYTPNALRLLRIANRFAKAIICNCSAVAEEVERRERVSGSKIHVIYNGLRQRRSIAETQTEDSRESPVRVCLVANIRPVKRVEDFVRAAAIVAAAAPDIEFLIVGEPSIEEYAAQISTLAQTLGLGERIRFTGAVQNPFPMIESCDIGVLASESEGLSNSLLEYMSCGLAVVCSDVGGNSELIEHRVNGLLYPVGDVELLAKHLITLCEDGQKRRTMRKESIRRASQFTSDGMVDAHVEMYRALGLARDASGANT